MTPKSQSKFNRSIKIPETIYRLVEIESYWIVTWLGKCFLEKDRIHREIFITNTKKLNYYFESDCKTYKVIIPEEQTIQFPLGTYLSYNGNFLKSPILEKGSNIKEINDVKIDPVSDYKTNGQFNVLKKSSYYPIYNAKNDYIYEKSPYYHTYSNGLEIIIPSHIILSYFYYYSTLSVYHIIYGIFPKACSFVSTNESDIILYDSHTIREKEITFLSKFYFIDGAINKLSSIHDDFFSNLYNQIKFKNKNLKFYLPGKIPYSELVSLKLIGVHINKNSFLVYGIKGFDLVSGNKKFNQENYKILDISEHYSNEEIKDNNLNNQLKVDYYYDLGKELSETNEQTNQNIRIIDVFEKNSNENKFLESPSINVFANHNNKENLNNSGNTIYDAIVSLSENIRNQNNQNKTARKNLNLKEPFDYIKVVYDTVNKLNEDINFEISYLYITQTSNPNTSHPPIELETIGELILISIFYENYSYCLIVRPQIKQRMVLLRFLYKDKKFNSVGDPSLKTLLTHMISNYNLNWYNIKHTLELEKYYFTYVHSFNHIVVENDHLKSVQNFTERIKEFYNSNKLFIQKGSALSESK